MGEVFASKMGRPVHRWRIYWKTNYHAKFRPIVVRPFAGLVYDWVGDGKPQKIQPVANNLARLYI
jgi:hypothetical protein